MQKCGFVRRDQTPAYQDIHKKKWHTNEVGTTDFTCSQCSAKKDKLLMASIINVCLKCVSNAREESFRSVRGIQTTQGSVSGGSLNTQRICEACGE